jgi:hypothetical protein
MQDVAASMHAVAMHSSSTSSSSSSSRMLDDEPAAGIQVAMRQTLFEYAASHGLDLIGAKLRELALPEVAKSFNVPLAGQFDVRLYDLKLVDFTLPSAEDAKLVILDEFFNLWVDGLGVRLSFTWHWEKPGLGLQARSLLGMLSLACQALDKHTLAHFLSLSLTPLSLIHPPTTHPPTHPPSFLIPHSPTTHSHSHTLVHAGHWGWRAGAQGRHPQLHL